MPYPIKKGLFVYCPESGRMIGINWPQRILWFLYPVVGIVALIWILIRVIPKPSRLSYPCIRAATPMAFSFLGYVLSLCFLAVFLRKAVKAFSNHRFLIAFHCILVTAVGILVNTNFLADKSQAGSVLSGTPNQPLGIARGIYPGRVVWTHDPNATFWDSVWDNQNEFYYWDSNHTDSAVVEKLLSNAVCTLTDQTDCKQAWDSIFRYYNKEHGKGDVGYQAGEKIVIKVNHNNQRDYTEYSNRWADTPPSVYVALLKQLVYEAGVAEDRITLVESVKHIDDKTYQACTSVFPGVRYVDSDGLGDRVGSDPVNDLIHWSGINEETGEPIPSYPIDEAHFLADYIINLGRMQGHGFAGVSFTAKNWFGSFGIAPNTALHDMVRSPYQEAIGYQVLVDLIGHRHLGAKTILYILDGLWGFSTNGKTENPPMKYSYPPFNNDYPSSLLLSQDPVAIDSVAFDFYNAQYPVNDMQYLHEAAMADNPPSGTIYDPEGDGTGVQSLGVHEHWNNSNNKQYSRNLGTGQGIELVHVSTQADHYSLPGDFNADGVVSEKDLKLLSNQWLSQRGDAGWNSSFDIYPIGGDGKIDIQEFTAVGRNWMHTDCGVYFAADFNRDCRVDWNDLILLASAWLAESGQTGWDSRCDIMPAGGDEKIDFQDILGLSEDWMQAYCQESFPADFNQNCRIGWDDLMVLASAWLSEPGQSDWDQRCDIQPSGGDQKIDFKDFAGLAFDWLKVQ